MRIKKEVIKPPIKLEFDKYDMESLSTFLQSKKDFVYEQIIDIINNGISLKLNSIDVFKFQNPKDILVFKRIEWRGFLERALPYFLLKENYEMCEKIKQTQLLLNLPKKKRGRPKKLN